MMRIIRQLATVLCVATVGFAAAGCGGEGGPTSAPPPPPGPPPPPPILASLSLQPGEVQVLTDPSTFRSFEIVGGPDAREYQVIVMSAGQTEDGLTPLRLAARAQGSANVVPAPSAAIASYAESPPPPSARSRLSALTLDEMARSRPAHLALQSQMQAEIRRVGARPARRSGPVGAGGDLSTSRSAAGASVPAVGDVVRILSAIVPSGGLSCNGSTPIDGVVKSVGQNFIIVEDPAMAGAFTPSDYTDLDREVDEFVAPVDQEYFGDPADLDGNGRTIAFFTRQVNRLSVPGSGSIVIGFFTTLDLLDPVDCPPSNEAEIIWLIAPDPNGEDGPPIPASFVKTIARGLIAHEFQHLLNAEQRVTLGGGGPGSTEETWINEGMSHIAEEVTGFHRIGVGTRANLGFSEISTGPLSLEVFTDFHDGNFRNLNQYLSSPSTVMALSTGGADFNTRGFGYLFLRWLGDRFGPAAPVGLVPGSGEMALFSELSSGGPNQLRGIDNVRRAINVVSGENLTWDDVLSEYFAAPAADEAVGGPPASVQFSTWNLPRLFDEMQTASVSGLAGGYPLRPRIISMGAGVSSTNNFDLLSSTARYFTLRSDGAHPGMAIEVSAQTGGIAPNGARARVIVVRTR